MPRTDHEKQLFTLVDTFRADPDRSKLLTMLAVLQIDSGESFTLRDYETAREWLTTTATDHPEWGHLLSRGLVWIAQQIVTANEIPN